MYSALIFDPPYRFYLRILTASYLRMKMSKVKVILDQMRLLDNDAFLQIIQSYHRPSFTTPTLKEVILTHQGTFKQVLNHFNLNHVDSYLDFGCGNGMISQSVGQLLSVEPHGMDIIDNISQIQYYQYDGKTLPSLSPYDLITCFNVLHHVESLDVSQLIGLLKPGGYFLLKEHDCYDEKMKLLIELQHLYYGDQMPIYTLLSKQAWIDKIGLKVVGEYQQENNPTACFYVLFQK